MSRPGWDEYFMIVADAVSTRSDCVRGRVGAVVVKDRRIRASGYNSSPAGMPGCEACPRRTSDVEPGSSYDTGPGRCVSVHAEMNCALYCDREDLIGSTVYITRPPCDGCSKMLHAGGVIRAVWPTGEVAFGQPS